MNPDTGAATTWGPGPDWATGFGRVDAQAAVNLIKADGFVEGDVTPVPTSPTTFPVSVVPGQGEVKVSLAWDDVAGAAGTDDAAAKLVNDLDLTLVDPNGVVHRPLVLPIIDPVRLRRRNGTVCRSASACAQAPDATPARLATPAAEGTDRRNVVEQVVVANPVPGSWTARVSVLNTDTTVRLPMLVATPADLLAGRSSPTRGRTCASTRPTRPTRPPPASSCSTRSTSPTTDRTTPPTWRSSTCCRRASTT